MTPMQLKDPKDIAAEHLEALRGYVKKALLGKRALTEEEEADKSRRMEEFIAIGNSFKLTGREMVGLLFEGLFTAGRRCGCPSCTSRRADA